MTSPAFWHRRRRLGRRELLRAGTRGAAGLAGLALVGCGGDDPVVPPARRVDAPADDEAAPDADVPQAAAEEDAPADVEDGVEEPDAPAAGPPAADEAPPAAEPAAPVARRILDPRACDGCTLEDPEFAPLFGSAVRFGFHEGAAYRMEAPTRWDGTLMLWARGFSGLNDVGTDFEPRIGFGALPFRELLLTAGVAWAGSTYAANGYVPARGVDDLLRTKDLFVAEFGEPARTICVGASMGGATAQLMAQEFPDEIDGALAFCGALSNVEVLDYLTSFHALAMSFIGEPPPAGDGPSLTAWGRRLGRPDGAGGLTLTPEGERFVAVVRELTGGERWGFEAGLADQWDLNFQLGAVVWPQVLAAGVDLGPGAVVAHGESFLPADTTAIVYGGQHDGLDIDALNEQVVRFVAPPGARDDPAFGPASGRLDVPLLTIKGTGDLFTPIALDAAYARRVEAAGNADNLVQRAVRHVGHCEFSTSEAVAGFLDLFDWIESGTRPDGEDLRGGLSAAGVAFTSPFDAGDPLAPEA